MAYIPPPVGRRTVFLEVPEMGFIVLAVLAVLTAATTVWLVHMRSSQESDQDATFWYTFAGLCVLAPLTLIPAWKNNLASLALLALAAGSAIAMHAWLRRQRTLASAASERAKLAATISETSALHNSLVARWSHYELDPAAAIDFPAMTDIRVPETSALIRAVAAAARVQFAEMNTEEGAATYRCAVATLAEALVAAEQAAHCPLTTAACQTTRSAGELAS